jgi:RNA-binding protein
MEKLTGYQKKYLRGLAHKLKPVVMVGQKGVTPALSKSVEAALMAHELIKVRFVENREREQKTRIITDITAQTGCEIAGAIGHTIILYRPHPEPDKQRIVLPR